MNARFETNLSCRFAFHFAAAAFAFAAVWHVIAMAVPAFATITYSAGYPAWRHVMFVLVNAGFAWLFLSRPVWLIWPYAVLTIQVIQGHGAAAW